MPAILNIPNSKSIAAQMERWQTTLDLWTNALKEKKDTIVMTDDNMDLNSASFNSRYKIGNIKKHDIRLHDTK